MNFSQNVLIARSQMWACCCCNGGCWNAVQQGRERHWDGFGWWNLEKRSEQPPWNLQKYDEISLLQLISDYIDHFSWTNFHDWNFMGPRRMAAEEAVEHPYFQEAQGSIKRLPYNVGLTGASSFFSSKCPWALGSSMDPCNMTYLGCCPPIGLAVWSFLKDFYPSEVHFGFKASETSLFY